MTARKLTLAGIELTWSPPGYAANACLGARAYPGYIAEAWQGHQRYEIRVVHHWGGDHRVQLSRDSKLIIALEAPTIEQLETLLIRCREPGRRPGPIRSALRILGSEVIA